MVERHLLYPPLDSEHSSADIPDVMLIGGKGRGLYWLAVHDFPAPATWVLSTELFDIAIHQAGVSALIGKIWQALQNVDDDWQATQAMLQALEADRQAVVEAIGHVSSFDVMQESLRKLPLDILYWAVRSSATVEDNPEYSFAGQFQSKLTVIRHSIWSAICEVWASTFNKTVLSYCVQHKTPIPQMAVVLQPMQSITAKDRAGVAFSHSPVPGMEGVLIQATFGSAEVVVQGYGGDLYMMQGDEVQTQSTPLPHIQISGLEGRIKLTEPPPGPVLSIAEAQHLANIVEQIATLWGSPVDVEFFWQAEASDPTIVQVRTATGLAQR